MSCDSGEAIRMLRDSDSWVYLRVQGGVGRGTGQKRVVGSGFQGPGPSKYPQIGLKGPKLRVDPPSTLY